MNLHPGLYGYSSDVIHVVDMHTTGEPTRIVTRGYPELKGRTLLEKRRDAKERYDHLRRRLMLEPRGHRDMYGALLIHETEHVLDGTADIGVLFLHNEGYSTMCGHATIALGRFLVDTHDTTIFPGRAKLPYDAASKTTTLRLHAPCGVVTVSVPTTCQRSADGTERLLADPERAVSFTSVPCFAPLIDYSFPISKDRRWPQLQASGREHVTISIAYGGAFYLLVDAKELGFPEGLRTQGAELKDYDVATRTLKALVEADEAFCKRYLRHPEEEDLSFLYSVMVVDQDTVPQPSKASSIPAETGLCFFADQQIDRSPTGSCACARVAARIAKGSLAIHTPRDFHSLVSLAAAAERDRSNVVDLPRQTDVVGAFRASGVRETEMSDGTPAVVVRLEGKAWYTGMSVLVAEKGDMIAHDGFTLHLPT